jgi:beta-lysine 5,6-aminomutase beta subunit
MGGGLYSINKKEYEKEIDPMRIKPYGDTLNDGKVQTSFTLPIENGEKALYAAITLAKKMGIQDPSVVHHQSLDEGFTFFIIYGELKHTIDLTQIKIESVEVKAMTMDEINEYIKENFNRKLVILGATTGNDAHTVGIDAIMNNKGFAGHYGLERYDMIEAYNLGSQVTNEEFIKKAINLDADVLLVSQTVTQKDIHVKNLTNLVDLLEAEGIREKVILICGGPRITNELAKELGYDAGFGQGTYAEMVVSFFIHELVNRERNKD